MSPTTPVSQTTPETIRTGSPTSAAPPESDVLPTASQRVPRPRRRRWPWVLAATVVVVALLLLGLGQVVRAVLNNAADDPRSTRASGAGALARLLRDEGVDVVPVNRSVSAERAITPDATLVVISPRLLPPDRVSALIAAHPARIVLVAPTGADLRRLGLTGASQAGELTDQTAPGCTDRSAVRADAIFPVRSPTYTVPAGATGCYPGSAGSAMVTTSVSGVPLTVLPRVISNDTLPVAGNAALAMNVLGEEPTLVWLMARDETPEAAVDSTSGPTLLPGWWPMLVVQVLVGLVAVGLWRGRRLGPILYESLPVRIRSSETVEGHGRLYSRSGARGAAAAALRAAAIDRLTSRYGHRADPLALIGSLAARTGRPVGAVTTLLTGPDPVTDQQLLDLKIDLDALEQEARQP